MKFTTLVLSECGRIKRSLAITFLFVCCPVVSTGTAQELEPRAYWISPVGTNSVYFVYAHSRGDFVANPTLPVEDVETFMNSSVVGYYRSLDFFGRSANFTFNVPYYWGDVTGLLEGDAVEIRRSGMTDTMFRFSANLLGAKAMDIHGFQEFRKNPGTIVGASIRIQPPTGQYDPNRLINLGTNRWSFKPQVGLIQPIRRRFAIELSLGVWFFTANQNFLGATKKQSPLATGEFHFVWRIRPAFWASFDTTFYYGGRSKTDGERQLDRQRNTRIGGTFAIPFGGRHVVKFSVSSGFLVSFGGDYSSFAISYTYGWISGN